MFGTQSKRDLALELQAQFPILRPSIHARRANLTVKFQDLYGFTVEGNVDDVNVLNEVREKVRQQGRLTRTGGRREKEDNDGVFEVTEAARR